MWLRRRAIEITSLTRDISIAGETCRELPATTLTSDNIALKEGRFISDLDDQQRANVMVIGVNAADALFPGQNTNIAGTQVRMGGYKFEIIGVLEKRKVASSARTKKIMPSSSLCEPRRKWLRRKVIVVSHKLDPVR